MGREWKLQDAKAHFSELVSEALRGEPQLVTRRGERAVVVIAYEDYHRLQAGNKSLRDIFSTAPKLSADELPIERDTTPVRNVELG